MINSNKHNTIVTDKLLSIGKTGEPMATHWPLGRRVRSTRLLETEPAMVKRFTSSDAAGKEPKWMDSSEPIPYLISLHEQIRASDDATKTMKRLKALWELSNRPNAKAKHLWKLIGQMDLWIAAYKKLAHNEGSMTKGGAGGTIDGTSLKTLKILRDKVIQGSYEFGLTRRVNSPKPDGRKRPLGIPQFRDRLLQEVLRTILETVYEPRFKQCSHGFRPQRSQHTCLRQVRRDFRGTIWYIEGHISKCFDTIDHHIVKQCLRKHIDDPKLIKLIGTGLKTKILMPEGGIQWMDRGTPQGGVCSPLLSNVVLHELDRFMLRLQRVIHKGKSRKQSKAYMQTYNKMRKASVEQQSLLRKQARKIGYGHSQDPTFRRLYYTRYADDFLVGIIGPKSLATRVKLLIASFLKQRLKLDLNQSKTMITRAKDATVPFLGYSIKSSSPHAYTYKRQYAGKQRQIKSLRSGNIKLLVPMQKVKSRLALKGFCDKRGQPKPNFTFLPHPQSYTIDKLNSQIRALCNYYKLSDGLRASISRINYILRYSTAKLFAAKFKLKTVSKVFAKGGKDLGKPIKHKKTPVGATDELLKQHAKAAGGDLVGTMPGILYTKYAHIPKPDVKPLAKNWNPWAGNKEQSLAFPLTKFVWRTTRGCTVLQAVCAQCGTTENVQMHHVRKLADLNKRTVVDQMMIAARRKQIPLCRSCHLAAHGKSDPS